MIGERGTTYESRTGDVGGDGSVTLYDSGSAWPDCGMCTYTVAAPPAGGEVKLALSSAGVTANRVAASVIGIGLTEDVTTTRSAG